MAIVAIDLGTTRVGIAVSTSGVLATPHAVIPHPGDVHLLIDRLVALAEELEAESFVVGLPRKARRGEGEGPYRDFAELLRQRTCKPVELWDETLSTVTAAEHLRATGRTGRGAKQSRDSIDMYAAAVILQSWLDHQGERT